MAVVTSADPSPDVAADAPDLTEAEQYTRVMAERRKHHGALAAFVAEYDRRATELARVRAAVTALAGELDGLGFNGFRDGAQVAARLRETLGETRG